MLSCSRHWHLCRLYYQSLHRNELHSITLRYNSGGLAHTTVCAKLVRAHSPITQINYSPILMGLFVS